MKRKIYEHLLAQDPIGAFEKIKEDYIRYFRHTYRIDQKDLNDKRIEKLSKDDNLYKEPYLEILPEYEAVNHITSIDDLATEFTDAFSSEEVSKQFFSCFIKQGLMNYLPYGHQVSMLTHAFKNKENVIITSGTGSGKTESFLLPLFAEIFKEAKGWKAPQYVTGADWFAGKRYTPRQRAGETRPSALRALVLYPMNALVEDQLARLRKALDSDKVRAFFDSDDGLKGNRIYFGRYTGDTLGSKSYDIIKERASQLNNNQLLLNKQNDVSRKLDELYKRYIKIEDKAPYVTTRLDKKVRTAEMVTRWDMQVTPPDIMITNVSMLSIMLMRKAEENMFEKTRDWLKEDKSHIFHLVIDELHLYRGTPGSEVACLLRMLLRELGLSPVIGEDGKKHRNPQLRILASSASLGVETRKYLEDFFGVYNDDGSDSFYIQEGTDYRPNADTEPLDYGNFATITPDFVGMSDDEKLKELGVLARKFNCSDIVTFIQKYERTIFSDFIHELYNDKDKILHPICYTDLFKKEHALFPDEESLRGFLIFRGYVDKINGLHHHLPRFRFHQFFKYIEGLWGELNPTYQDPGSTPISPESLAYVPQEVGPHNRKVLELLRCECCGELFIGGNKKVDENGGISLFLNYPDLSHVPNFNPTPMVQNKSFKEYALFWPTQTKGIVLESEEEHVASLYDGETAFGRVHARAIWEHGYLNVNTGKFTTDLQGNVGNLIEGLKYSLKPYDNHGYDESLIQAMPCCCPKCRQNYTERKYAKSPIRSFRTGLERNNQLISKDLIYQLSEGSGKLIGFSDSREDAAKQAFGIEKEQYRDMVRMLFVDCVKEKIPPINEIAHRVKQEWDNNTDLWNIPGIIKENFVNCHVAEDISKVVLGNIKEESNLTANLDKYRSNIVDLESFVGKGNALDGILVKKLVKLGINPAGVDYDKQFCDQERSMHWSEAFDFDEGTIRSNAQTDQNYVNGVKKSLISAIYSNSFGKYMGVSTVDSGIGYICCKRTNEVEKSDSYNQLKSLLMPSGISVYDFVDAYIRILGDNYRYEDPDYESIVEITEYGKAGKRLKSVIKKFSELYAIDENILGNTLFDFLKKFCGSGMKLEFNSLAFKMVDGEDFYYECPKCHRIHLNKGFGFCTNTNCLQRFDNTVITGKVKNLWNHFISYDILVEPKEPRRLHTEELTGQTDNIQDRLLEFKDIILLDQGQEDKNYRKGYELTKSIDMVNVTTTMEVGVDIGSLEAIFQGNMPPTRYNYQQRVGRGGRRGQAFSTAVTFCRGRSHDVYYYYKATEEMLGSVPAAPKLSLAPYKDMKNGIVVYEMKQAIMKRVIVKSVFREALRGQAFDYDLIDNAGEFGRVGEWESKNKVIIRDWIENNGDVIRDIINSFFAQYNRNGIDISQGIEDIYYWVVNDLVKEIDNVVSKYPNKFVGLAQCMAEAGFLPMYGLPSDLRLFYHGFDEKHNEVKSIDRNLDMSINEFAPGCEKTKDKGKYRVEGITLPIIVRKKANNTVTLCFDEGVDDALSDRYTICFDKDIISGTIFPDASVTNIENITVNDDASTVVKNYGLNQRLLIIPHAYRSWNIIGNMGHAIDNNERRSAFSQSIIFAKDDSNCSNVKSVGNVKLSVYGVNLHDASEVWYINTNNNQFFTGKYDRYRQPGSNNGVHGNFMFYEYTQDKGNAGQRRRIVRDNNTIDIALGARKPTEMIRIQLDKWNDCLNLKLESGNRSAIRAAFYSAAFLLQRTLADKLDVQPEEIEISEKIVDDSPVIYLNDALPNGAGLVGYLFDEEKFKEILKDIVEFRTNFMQSLLAKEHRYNCCTACQKCLDTYTNRGFHHVLDWRMGVGIINLMLDATYDFGFSGALKYPELHDSSRIIEASAKKLNFEQKDPDQICWIRKQGFRSDLVMIYHPLWDRNKTIEVKLKNVSQNYSRIQMYNTFNLLRSDVTIDEIVAKPKKTDTVNYTVANDNPRFSNGNSVIVSQSAVSDEAEPARDKNGIVPNVAL